MGMSVGPADGDEETVVSEINTTPLVDVMLVLLIIFLLTIPVAIQTVPVTLPSEANVPTVTKPENVTIAVDADGNIYWNASLLPDTKALFERMKEVAVLNPQPEIHIRGDKEGRYEAVGKVVVTCQRAGIMKIGFITEPPAGVMATGGL
ncbi:MULTISPECIES: biopolymer transporter ExbD [unclassified Azospirillum]|jgi:biopolymer transport protein ExbD|uniref:ExbD/TolR family protein n=1 Tax=unclassified Azospirillum TaxID=2630922 RepID=UPI000B7608DE|nr:MULTISPECIES: biopolymer transporter ExbD [unclassified Azospirillum]SNR93373.1 outer membrane transport energization protein ExbD [Azospirillum sp. RU38E]SNS09310.1 outer membrane transport energization protein ExbD [Azospirillum sp. RU37A]